MTRCATRASIGYRKSVSVWEIIVVYAVLPALIVGVLGVLSMGVSRGRAKARYEPGQAWTYPNQLWAGASPIAAIPMADRVGTKRGGAHGGW